MVFQCFTMLAVDLVAMFEYKKNLGQNHIAPYYA